MLPFLNKKIISRIFSFCLITVILSSFLVSGNQSTQFRIGDILEYEIIECSEFENMFFGAWPPGEYFGNWSAVVGDQITFEILNITTTNIEGTLNLGNYTFNNVRLIDVASALALSIYPWNGGFIANTSAWSEIKTDLETTNTTITDLEAYSFSISGSVYSFDVYLFKTTNYYGQNCTFYYDSDTGLLLKGYTAYGDYFLNITLSTLNFDISTRHTNIASIDFISILSIIAFVHFIYCKQKRR